MVSKESVFHCPCKQPRKFGSSKILESIISKVNNCRFMVSKVGSNSLARRVTNLRSPVKSVKSRGPRKNQEIPNMKNQCAVNFWKKNPIKWCSFRAQPHPFYLWAPYGDYINTYNHDHFIAYIIHYISLSHTIYHSLYLYIITGLLHAKVEKAWFSSPDGFGRILSQPGQLVSVISAANVSSGFSLPVIKPVNSFNSRNDLLK